MVAPSLSSTPSASTAPSSRSIDPVRPKNLQAGALFSSSLPCFPFFLSNLHPISVCLNCTCSHDPAGILPSAARNGTPWPRYVHPRLRLLQIRCSHDPTGMLPSAARNGTPRPISVHPRLRILQTR
ncbi:hypothetical protein ZWY2020_005177 [Hordeum vulgare]|nr:hypothetical protein ZWY2020_005177 [Hordeum vulgare]